MEPTRVACVGLKGIHNTSMDLELELQMEIDLEIELEPILLKKFISVLEFDLEPSRVACVP